MIASAVKTTTRAPFSTRFLICSDWSCTPAVAKTACSSRHSATAANPITSTHSSAWPNGVLAIVWKAPFWSVCSPPVPKATCRASHAMSRYVMP